MVHHAGLVVVQQAFQRRPGGKLEPPQNGHMKSMNRSTRTGPAPTLIPSPSPVAPAGMTLGAAGPVIGLSSEGNPEVLATVIRLTSAGMSGHPSDRLILRLPAPPCRERPGLASPRIERARIRREGPPSTGTAPNADSSPQGSCSPLSGRALPDDAPPRKRGAASRPPGCATPAQSPVQPGSAKSGALRARWATSSPATAPSPSASTRCPHPAAPAPSPRSASSSTLPRPATPAPS